MLSYWFQYDTITGILYGDFLQEEAPSSSMGLIGPYPQDTAPADVIWATVFPGRYLVQSGILVEQPYFNLVVTAGTNISTVTATLCNSPATPPTSVTFTVAGSSLVEQIVNGVAKLTIGIHPAIAQQLIDINISAIGCMNNLAQVGGFAQEIGLQLVTLSGVPTVCPTGPGSEAFLDSFYYSDMEQQIGLEAVAMETTLNMNLLLGKIIPALMQPTYTPITLTPTETAAFAAIQSQVLPYLPYTLATIPQSLITVMQGVNVQGSESIMQFEKDLATIPNLE